MNCKFLFSLLLAAHNIDHTLAGVGDTGPAPAEAPISLPSAPSIVNRATTQIPTSDVEESIENRETSDFPSDIPSLIPFTDRPTITLGSSSSSKGGKRGSGKSSGSSGKGSASGKSGGSPKTQESASTVFDNRQSDATTTSVLGVVAVPLLALVM